MARRRRSRWSVAEFAAALAGILLLVLAVSLDGQGVKARPGQLRAPVAKCQGTVQVKARG